MESQKEKTEQSWKLYDQCCTKTIYRRNYGQRAANTAVYVINRTGKSKVCGKTPQDSWSGKQSRIERLIIFGAKANVHIPQQRRKKSDGKAEEGVFVCYGEDVKGFKIWYPATDIIKYARDVIFLETKEDLSANEKTEKGEEVTLEIIPEGEQIDHVSEHDDSEDEANTPNDSTSSDNSGNDEAEGDSEEDPIGDVAQDEPQRNLRNREILRKPSRYDGFLDIEHLFLTLDDEPRSYQEAILRPDSRKWIQAMNEEMESVKKNETWTLEPTQNWKNVIDCRWVFKIKRRPDGHINRYKARLVAKGYEQKHGVNYQETFSLVVKFDSLRMILAIVAAEDMKLHQFDVKTAFLYGNLEENILMKQPEGCDDGTDRVCRLNKSLYGLKQASRCWNERFGSFLRDNNFKETYSDPCVFISEG